MGESVLQRSFSAGELDPAISVRADLQTYAQGLRTCRNFLVRRSGGVQSRPGLEHVATAKLASPTFLFAFVFPAADESYLVEAGNLYFRFHHRLRGMVLELTTPYTIDNLQASVPLCWHQHGRVVSLTHHVHPPMDLTFVDVDTFTLTVSNFAPSIAPPTGLTVTASTTIGSPENMDRAYWYKVTAVKVGSYEESLPSAPVYILSCEGSPDAPVKLEWTAVPNAIEYKVYRDDGENGTFGYLGTATGNPHYNDIGVLPDFAFTPPIPRTLFAANYDYPHVSVTHNQRRIYAGTDNTRDTLWASRIGQATNFTHRSPMQDDDAITWRTASQDLQVVIHLLTLGPLVVLTDRGEWLVMGDSDGALTPTTINPLQKGYVGAGWATPVVYGERILFVQARDTVVREIGVNQNVEGLSGRDLTRNAAHLFRSGRIFSMAFALIPDAILWCVREDGVLLGLTYVPDEDVLAWHRHDTEDGLFERVCVIPEKTEDAVYVVVNRGGTRSIERLGVRDDLAPLALDRAVRVRGPATTVVSGLAHLAGQPVRVVMNGRPHKAGLLVSAAGEVTLPTPAEVVDVGLPIVCDLASLELDTATSDVRDRRKKVTSLAILVEQSLHNFTAGPDFTHLRPVRAPQWLDPGAPFTGRIELAPTTYYNDEGRVVVRHTEPTTLTVLGLLPNVDIGG